MPVGECYGPNISGVAVEAITKHRFCNTNGTTAKEALQISICDSGEVPTGVSADTYALGAPAMIFVEGSFVRLEVDGGTAISPADNTRFLKPHTDSGGRGLVAATTEKYYAEALEPSTAAGDIIRCIVRTGVTP